MLTADDIFRWADQAVGQEILEGWPGHSDDWRDIAPANLGLEQDDWLLLSKRMIQRFNALLTANGLAAVTMREPARAQYRSRVLISFVTAIADLGDQQL